MICKDLNVVRKVCEYPFNMFNLRSLLLSSQGTSPIRTAVL